MIKSVIPYVNQRKGYANAMPEMTGKSWKNVFIQNIVNFAFCISVVPELSNVITVLFPV